MNILVLVKQVPDSATTASLTPDATGILHSPAATYRINRFDEYALEEALLIKDRRPTTRVDVLSLGPERVKEAIRRAIGMGADEGFHVAADDDVERDPGTVAARIATVAQKGNYDLILSGVMSEDSLQAQTGQMVAEMLELPCVTSVVELRLAENGRQIELKRELEGGIHHRIEVPLPCVLTIQAGNHSPRYPVLSKVLRAAEKTIPTAAIAPGPARQSWSEVSLPQKQRAGVMITGDRAEKVREMARILRQKNCL